mgnify:CR=1 FL=1
MITTFGLVFLGVLFLWLIMFMSIGLLYFSVEQILHR